MSARSASVEPSRWPHRCAAGLCCLTFPLLVVGQLITTTDAGMAVPDWPETYGYNMFLYPWEMWFFGPWDLFVEHGHRLLASLVGLVTIGFLLAVIWKDGRRGMIALAVAALVLVIVQGVLGGLRVRENERLLAMIHGCVGPLFFAFTTFLVIATSRAWRTAGQAGKESITKPTGLARLAGITALLAFLQLVLGAALRHIDASTSPWTFAVLIKFHLGMAAVVALHLLTVAWRALRVPGGMRGVRGLGVLLGLLACTQLGLGLGAWWAKYGLPGWAAGWRPATMEATIAGGWWQTNMVTAHSAVGSLLLGLLVALAAIASRGAPTVESVET